MDMNVHCKRVMDFMNKHNLHNIDRYEVKVDTELKCLSTTLKYYGNIYRLVTHSHETNIYKSTYIETEIDLFEKVVD